MRSTTTSGALCFVVLWLSAQGAACRTTANAGNKQNNPRREHQCRDAKRSVDERQKEIRAATARDCGRSYYEKLLQLDKLRIDVNQTSQSDVVSVSVSYNSSVLLTSDLALELKVEKVVLGMPFKLPCLPSKKQPTVMVGSCVYKDFCSTLQSSRCRTAADTHSSSCTCARLARATTRRTRTFTFVLPSDIVSAYTQLSNGDYVMKLELVQVKTMRVLGCVEAKWTLAAKRKQALATSDEFRHPWPSGDL